MWKIIKKLKRTLLSEKAEISPSGGKHSIALAFPNTYYIGMSNLGFQTVYRLFNILYDVTCERVFLPDPLEEKRHNELCIPLLSLETQTPVEHFEIIAFSITHENDYINILKILQMANIPLIASERTEMHPLVIAGGISISINPEPIAPFFDLFIIGEAEAVLNNFWELYSQTFKENMPREKVLSILSTIPGIYCPALYEPEYDAKGQLKSFVHLPVCVRRTGRKDKAHKKIKRQWISNNSLSIECSSIVTPLTEFKDMALIETGKGCSRGCRFCVAGFISRPPRHQTIDRLIKKCIDLADKHKNIGLVGAAISDIPGIKDLCSALKDLPVHISVSSLRADSISMDIINLLASSGHKTLTIAPEAGSQRLRDIINKNITEEDILNAASMIFDAGILNLKLYFLIGLPYEIKEDIDEIIILIKKIKKNMLNKCRDKKRIGTITISINPFVPKPFTPFQWEPFENIKSLEKKISCIRTGLSKETNIKLNIEPPKKSYFQTALARGDRRCASILLKMHEKKSSNWKKAAKECNINLDFYVYRKIMTDELLPWDFIDHGIDKNFLIKEWQRALYGHLTPPCNTNKCRICGVCEQ